MRGSEVVCRADCQQDRSVDVRGESGTTDYLANSS